MTDTVMAAQRSCGEALQSPPINLLRDASLFLDFDGTLVDLADRPDGVAVDDGLRMLIDRLAGRLDGRIAIVSGRPADAIANFLGEGVAISGSHGLEMRWLDGRVEAPDRPASLDEALAELHDFANGRDGVLIEDKPLGVGLHYREAGGVENDAQSLVGRIAERTGLSLQSGKKVFELRVAGANKGEAIRRFADTLPFAGSRPVFLGDDVTDEDGFAAAAHLGGAGVLVGEARATDARYRLSGVEKVREWLEAACSAL